MIEKIVLIIAGIISFAYLLTVIFYPLYIKRGIFAFFYHDVMLWCRPDYNTVTFNGWTAHAKCKHCGKDIIQDSQGNWFYGRGEN